MKKGIIIGAGIGGLTTAIALAKNGIDLDVYEQATEINEVGAGIWVAPNGLKVFDKLGFSNEIIQSGNILDMISVVDINLKPISIIDGNKVRAKHGFKTVAIHRATLQNILAQKFDQSKIYLNKRLESYSQSNEKVTVRFEDGTHAEGDFLILADGIKSKGRLQMQGALNLRYSGQTCWRFVSEFTLPEAEQGKMLEIWGNQKGLRIGYSQINSKESYVFITNYEPAGGKDDVEVVKSNLIELCAEFPTIVKQLIESANPNSIIRSDLFDFKPIKTWTDNRVTLLGDAAHATTPNLGQGACQAIEDAFVLSQHLSKETEVPKGLINYEKARIEKATYITNTSWQFAKITNTNGLMRNVITAVLRLTPNSVSKKQLDKIYKIQSIHDDI